MEIVERLVNDESVVVLQLKGKLTIGAGDIQLRETVRKWAGSGKNKFALGMKDVTMLDSAGVGELVAEHVSAKNSGGGVALFSLSDKVGGVLAATQLTGILGIFETEDEAIASFG